MLSYFNDFFQAIDRADLEKIRISIDGVDFLEKDNDGDNALHCLAARDGFKYKILKNPPNQPQEEKERKTFFNAESKCSPSVLFTFDGYWKVYYRLTLIGKNSLMPEEKVPEKLREALEQYKMSSDIVSASDVATVFRATFVSLKQILIGQNSAIRFLIFKKLVDTEMLKMLLEEENKQEFMPLEVALDIYDPNKQDIPTEINLLEFLGVDQWAPEPWHDVLLENIATVLYRQILNAKKINDIRLFARVRKLAQILWNKGWYHDVFDRIRKRDEKDEGGGPSFFERVAVYPDFVKALLLIEEKKPDESKGPEDQFFVKSYDVLKLRTSRGNLLHALISSYIEESCKIAFDFAVQSCVQGGPDLFLEPNSEGDLPLHGALDKRCLPVVQALLAKMLQVSVGLNTWNGKGFLPIQMSLTHPKLTQAIVDVDTKPDQKNCENLKLSNMNKAGNTVLHEIALQKKYVAGNLIFDKYPGWGQRLVAIGNLEERTPYFIFYNMRDEKREVQGEKKFGDKLEQLCYGTDVKNKRDYLNFTAEDFKHKVLDQKGRILTEAKASVCSYYMFANIALNVLSTVFSILESIYEPERDWTTEKYIFFISNLFFYASGVILGFHGVYQAHQELNEVYKKRKDGNVLESLQKPNNNYYYVGFGVLIFLSIAAEVASAARSTSVFKSLSKEEKSQFQMFSQTIAPFIAGTSFLLLKVLLKNEVGIAEKIKDDRRNKLFSRTREKYIAFRNSRRLIQPLASSRSALSLGAKQGN